ncbi:VOC family protein [Chloroflexus aggregans]|uniref:Glyoxalase/bleomycin resistance protein/dioxygenase n=1 Tax=Chloroflexus aggregans (strain MD-66 / DSM 9485) TaxID=326427 RepID=B8G4E6_CHLAD|nr:VOC family protein [Chloroflexus aggregans]ACL23552.1 Glyoxalase/bleomycin resistance protein/dioxygenase [Chloroflexus aggregans DSM 9485]
MSTGLHPATQIGTVALTINDLERSLAFYQHLIGLRLHRRDGSIAYLGAGGDDLLVLYHEPHARRYRTVCGLYHFAILLPNRYELARALARLYQAHYPHAPTDHVMTKSTYLDDPDGNGIEIYCESPEDGVFVMNNDIFFARRADGSLSDGREPLDVPAFLRLIHAPDEIVSPIATETRIGHIHLHVADLDRAVQFYHGVLGFDVQGVMRRFQMAMVSAGGYHHHIGLNTWRGEGIPPAPVNAIGLRWFEVVLPDDEALTPVLERVQAAGIACEQHPTGWHVVDPFGHRVVLTTPAMRANTMHHR